MEKIREHSFQDETYQIGIDFDGVIHRNSKGFFDGTVYDVPVEGVYEALQTISKNYTIIVYSAKARKDRMLIKNKTGVELIWEWLKKYKLDKFVTDVTSEKPRAVCYIDDKAFRFTTWGKSLKELKEYNIM
mgnify:FL=1